MYFQFLTPLISKAAFRFDIELSNIDSTHEQSLQTVASNRTTRTEHESSKQFHCNNPKGLYGSIEEKMISVCYIVFQQVFSLLKDHRTVPI